MFLIITFDHIREVTIVANCHLTMYNVKYVLLDYIRASYSVFNKLGGFRGDLGCLMAQVLVMMFRTESAHIGASHSHVMSCHMEKILSGNLIFLSD